MRLLRDAVTDDRTDRSQFGNRQILQAIFDVIGVEHRRCCEAGAGDGFDCSNTYEWWHDDQWGATLIEADQERYAAAVELVRREGVPCVPMPGQRDFVFDVDGPDNHTVRVLHSAVTADNINALVPERLDFLSIDVDGADFWLWSALTHRPRVLIIERNQSIPWWMDVVQDGEAGSFGASAAALNRVSRSRDYRLVEAVGPDLFFVDAEAVGWGPTSDLAGNRSWSEILIQHEREEPAMSYLATDYHGNPRILGQMPPWGLTVDIPHGTDGLIVGD